MTDLKEIQFIPIFNDGIISTEEVTKRLDFIKNSPISVIGEADKALIIQFWDHMTAKINPLRNKVEYGDWKELPNASELHGGLLLTQETEKGRARNNFEFYEKPITAIYSFHNADLMQEGKENSAVKLSGKDLLDLLGSQRYHFDS